MNETLQAIFSTPGAKARIAAALGIGVGAGVAKDYYTGQAVDDLTKAPDPVAMPLLNTKKAGVASSVSNLAGAGMRSVRGAAGYLGDVTGINTARARAAVADAERVIMNRKALNSVDAAKPHAHFAEKLQQARAALRAATASTAEARATLKPYAIGGAGLAGAGGTAYALTRGDKKQEKAAALSDIVTAPVTAGQAIGGAAALAGGYGLSNIIATKLRQRRQRQELDSANKELRDVLLAEQRAAAEPVKKAGIGSYVDDLLGISARKARDAAFDAKGDFWWARNVYSSRLGRQRAHMGPVSRPSFAEVQSLVSNKNAKKDAAHAAFAAAREAAAATTQARKAALPYAVGTGALGAGGAAYALTRDEEPVKKANTLNKSVTDIASDPNQVGNAVRAAIGTLGALYGYNYVKGGIEERDAKGRIRSEINKRLRAHGNVIRSEGDTWGVDPINPKARAASGRTSDLLI